MNPVLQTVTEQITQRSQATRAGYLQQIERCARHAPHRQTLSCSNLAHAFAACPPADKSTIRMMDSANVAIVSAYNDMLSAHQPLGLYPDIIKSALHKVGCTAQVAGGVPAMCDGVTQGQPGMELSLFSRDQIAMSTALALSHNMFDAVVLLGVCDKIVPGMLIGALRFGHLPAVFIPAGPMPSGLNNEEKARIRQEYAKGNLGREELLTAESSSYHSPGTCTFYGTSNTNQMLMEIMGLQLPGSSFVNPGTPLRQALIESSVQQLSRLTKLTKNYMPLGHLVDEKAIVNGVVGLLATGGSTNLTIHLIAIARAAGIQLTWQDFSELSQIIPLLTRVYPNGSADVNHFHAAGGVGFVIRELLSAGLLHQDVQTLMGPGLDHCIQEPFLSKQEISWQPGCEKSLNEDILRPVSRPFRTEGGLQFLEGNLGNGVIKTSAVKEEHLFIEAPAIIFSSQDAFETAFKAGELSRDCIAVVRFQGPRSNGMPELHKLTPALGALQEQGFKVALVTDGRMSGASGKIPAAIHLCPEAAMGGPLAKLRNGDLIRLDAVSGTLQALVDEQTWSQRSNARADQEQGDCGLGRELFTMMREHVSTAETGATIFKFEDGVQ